MQLEQNNSANKTGAFRRGYRLGKYLLYPDLKCILVDQKMIQISPTAVRLLIVLVERHGQTVTKNELIKEVWFGSSVEESNITVHVSALRKLLGSGAVRTIYGEGYQYNGEVAAFDDAAELPPGVSVQTRYGFHTAQLGPKTNLPQKFDVIIDRVSDLVALSELILDKRLVTLTGPGGIGKTRLALEFGWEIASSFPDGVWLVDLAPVREPAVVASAIAMTLGVAGRGAEPLAVTISGAIGRRRLLLIIDNCEHLQASVSELVVHLLQYCSNIVILATSQVALQVPTEQTYLLDALTIPPSQPGGISCIGAVALFSARATAADRRFVLDKKNSNWVVEICRRLDGNPLALEMAAPLVRLFGVKGLLSRLDERLRLLGNDMRSGQWRYHSLRDMVVWSYGLLDVFDQRVFRRLGVFAGTFTLDAAAAVASDEDAVDEGVSKSLRRLVDKSLIQVEASEPPRFRMLETLRLYAADQLRVSGEAETIAERQARYVAAYFEPADGAWETISDAEWLTAYRPDIDNVRIAADWALSDPGRSVLAVAVIGGSARLWALLDLYAEGKNYCERAIAVMSVATPDIFAARLLKNTGTLWQSTDPPRALSFLQHSLGLYKNLNDDVNAARVHDLIAICYRQLGRHEEAKSILTAAVEVLRKSNQKKSLLLATLNLAVVCSQLHESDVAKRNFSLALDLAHLQNDAYRAGYVLLSIAESEFKFGSIDKAISQGREAVRYLRGYGKRYFLQFALSNLASYLIIDDNVQEARTIAREAISLARGDSGYIVTICLQQWVLLGVLAGKHRNSAIILGFVDSVYADTRMVREPTEQRIYRRALDLLTAALPESSLSKLKEIGASLSQQDVISMVFDKLA